MLKLIDQLQALNLYLQLNIVCWFVRFFLRLLYDAVFYSGLVICQFRTFHIAEREVILNDIFERMYNGRGLFKAFESSD